MATPSRSEWKKYPPVGKRIGISTAHGMMIPWKVSFFALGAIWGCSFWFIKLGLRSFSPVDVAFGRLVLGAVTLVIVALVTRTSLPHDRATWGHLFVLALLLNSVPFTLFAFGETRIDAALAGIINGLTPMVTLGVSLLVFRQVHPTAKLLGGLLVGFVGVLFVTGIWNGFGTSQLLGIGACLLAVISFGVAFPYSSRLLAARGDSPVSLAAGQLICGVSQLLPFAIVIGGPVGHPHSSSVLGMLALGVFGTGFAYVLYFHIAGHTSAAIASSVTYLTPIVAVIVAAVFLSESITWYEPAGGALILLGTAISQNNSN
jgi:drug/metabolite transporter (DMT)-like permease